MKKLFIAIAFLFSLNMNSQTVLSLSTTIQSQNQWCWSACSNCILRHYGVNTTQCQLAEYTRTVATWNNFGTQDCCTNPSGPCNYWNYMWGYAGSIQDLLLTFGSISVTNISNTISSTAIATEINASRPFVVRWGWTSGGGHFIVGEGYDASNNVYYMNPWPGEGSKMSTYGWLVNDGVHSWTHTQKMITNPPLPTGISGLAIDESGISIYPNPANDKITINSKEEITSAQLFDVAGKEILSVKNTKEINLKENQLSKGIYFLKISGEDFSVNKKVILE
jgi:hypothetical protein